MAQAGTIELKAPQELLTASQREWLSLCTAHLNILVWQAWRGDQLEYQATHDVLTGLLNRRAFNSDAEQALTREVPTTLTLLDIRQFKQVNDTFGHVQGDQVLQALARALVQHLPPPHRVYRLAGDEFAVLSDWNAADLTTLSAYLQETLASVVGPRGLGTLRTDLGSVTTRPRETLSNWLTRADQAMYQAKRQHPSHVALSERSQSTQTI